MSNPPSLPRLCRRTVFAGMLLFAAMPGLAQAPRVEAGGEILAGTTTAVPGVSAFLGIPFAQPPLGELRWSAPREYTGNGGTRQATDFAPACMQTPRIVDWYRDMAVAFGATRSVVPDLPISEDCLYLNVWTPDAHATAKLPVMVYIHGGSNNSGWAWEPNYHGHALAAQGVVVVSIAYRLGVFGFFSHPELAGQDAQANFGLWDQLAALRWVKRHIADFGGDPGRVTVFGESAGAGDAGLLMLSPLAQGLLARAILQSSANIGIPAAHSLAEEQARGTLLARGLDAASPPDLAALRALPAAVLMDTANTVFRDHYHAPVVDGQIVRAQTRELLAAGKYPAGQLLIGTNADEWFSSTPENPDARALDDAIAKAQVLNTPEARALLAASPELRGALDRLRTADSMLCPSQILASSLARNGRGVWMYRFSRVRDGAVAASMKAYHGAELPYVFGTHDAWFPTSATDHALTRQMMRYWVQFATTGDPNRDADPAWPAFTAPDYPVQELGDRVHPIATPEPGLCGLYAQRLDSRNPH